MQALLAEGIYLEITLRLVAALVIGGLIGLERSYNGRPAGFRTHALVCLSTCLLMLVTVYEMHWVPAVSEARLTLDPTRMAQGIMTGIGFLGAGTIMKDGLSVRGLTTAASIWTTAAIGILVGIGFYFPAVFTTVLTLGTLSIFRQVENLVPARCYAGLILRFVRGEEMPESELRKLLTSHGFIITKLSYRLDTNAYFFQYRMTIRTARVENVAGLNRTLNTLTAVKEFRLSPAGD
ncbi:MAG TPA: MgtC/SapB family protein [Gammaproteobacteria bacterium]